MAEDDLNRARVSSSFEEVGGERVAKHVRGNTLAEAARLRSANQRGANSLA